MSREIKFRAWNTESPESGMSPTQTLLEWFGVYSRMGTHERDETCVWMQYTGLKDKNGVEIYEGDIIEWDDKRFVVEYKAPRVTPFMADYTKFKVIGNIYENPEFLEVSND